MTRLAMWSGPRNLSTALMRSWENRPDTVVIDEPLYAAFLARTGLDHPGAAEIVESGIVDVDDAIAACFAPLPTGISVSYQKHMAHHLPVDRDLEWIDGLHNCLLLRDPRRVLASYTRVREKVTLHDLGLPQQIALADHCDLIIDSDDFLAEPKRYLSEICRAIDVPFDPSMLNWPAGGRSSDGVWAKHWYSAVEASTHFGPPPKRDPASPPTHLHRLSEEAMTLYEQLRTLRLRF